MLKPTAYARMILIACAATLSGARPGSSAEDSSAAIKLEYLMSLQATLDAPQAIDPSLSIFNVPLGGWVEGPKIKGKIVAPSADWLRTMPSGIRRLDVRLTIQTDDGQLIYASYNGVIQCSKEQLDRLTKGEVIKANDCYFITAPTFETQSERYGWLNAVQAIGKAASLKRGPDGHVRYDIFAVK